MFVVNAYTTVLFYSKKVTNIVSVARHGPTQYKFQLIQENKNNTSLMFLNVTLIIY